MKTPSKTHELKIDPIVDAESLPRPLIPQKRKVGRPASVTVEVVQRVGELMAKGVPLKYALLKENPPIKEDAFHKCLQRHTELSTLYERKLAEFIEAACNRLVSERDPANLRWILERRHSEFFGKAADTVVAVAQTTIAGVPEEVLDELRKVARRTAGFAPELPETTSR
jgi:hypothetical protein